VSLDWINRRLFVFHLGLSCLVTCVWCVPTGAQETKAPVLVLEEELLNELKSAPNENLDRVQRLKELYVQAGAIEADIELVPVKPRRESDPPLDNVIVTKRGETDQTIVVGGHLDKVRAGTGIVDDWSGACMATNLYQAIRELPTKHTFRFVGFAYEEQGLLGSKQYVEALGDHAKEKVDAMVNLECLGVGGPFLWTNGSTDGMEAIAHRVANRLELPLVDHVIQGVGADSIPFDRAGIPNLTFDGLPLDRFKVIHSEEDRFESIDAKAYVTTYQLVTHYLLELDRAPAEELAPTPDPTPKVSAPDARP
jgi:Iap family predicted aminopeptidase